MTRKILIATRNRDKFDIVRKMLEEVSVGEFQFVNLKDLEIDKDTKEVGSIMERAEQKARLLMDDVGEKVDGIIGIDDGIKIKGITTTETKSEADKILLGDYLDLDEVVYIIRGFFIVNTKTGATASCMNEIPFKYFGSNTQIKLVEGMYPLSYVLGRVNGDNTIAHDVEEDSHRYYMDYSEEGLKKLFEVF